MGRIYPDDFDDVPNWQKATHKEGRIDGPTWDLLRFVAMMVALLAFVVLAIAVMVLGTWHELAASGFLKGWA